MHRQEVPLVNVFREGVKSDLENLAKTHTSSFSDRAQKTIFCSAYAFGEMYVTLAKANKKMSRVKKLKEAVKGKMVEAQEAIREKNTTVLQKAALAKEVEELREKHAESKKARDGSATCVEAIETYRLSNELNSYILERLVDKQLA
ncbi:hypothetical protein ACE6H2_026582 [Prunus campanulata]